jgi:hypothetical protein
MTEKVGQRYDLYDRTCPTATPSASGKERFSYDEIDVSVILKARMMIANGGSVPQIFIGGPMWRQEDLILSVAAGLTRFGDIVISRQPSFNAFRALIWRELAVPYRDARCRARNILTRNGNIFKQIESG